MNFSERVSAFGNVQIRETKKHQSLCLTLLSYLFCEYVFNMLDIVVWLVQESTIHCFCYHGYLQPIFGILYVSISGIIFGVVFISLSRILVVAVPPLQGFFGAPHRSSRGWSTWWSPLCLKFWRQGCRGNTCGPCMARSRLSRCRRQGRRCPRRWVWR